MSASISRRLMLKGLATAGAGLVLGGCEKHYVWLPAPRYDPSLAAPKSPTDASAIADPLFRYPIAGGFESSTHIRKDGKRLDVIASTRHDEFAYQDYRRMRELGMTVCRDTARWHLIDRGGQYDFSSMLPMIRAAERADIAVIWDLFHYGWPDDLNIFRPSFVTRFVKYVSAVTRLIKSETDAPLLITPVNEISFLSWAAGDREYFFPFAKGRGFEMKCQLVRCTVEAIDAIWQVDPEARIMHIDPLINVISRRNDPDARKRAEDYRLAQYQSWDMIRGELWPALGGRPEYLDVIGINYYDRNQSFFEDGQFIPGGHPQHRPLAEMLKEVWQRYRRPLVIAETGVEDDARGAWMRYVAGEVGIALRQGVPVHGICWYPILNHAGWDDDRHCRNGLWDYPDDQGNRPVYQPLADEIRRVAPGLAELRRQVLVRDAAERQAASNPLPAPENRVPEDFAPPRAWDRSDAALWRLPSCETGLGLA